MRASRRRVECREHAVRQRSPFHGGHILGIPPHQLRPALPHAPSERRVVRRLQHHDARRTIAGIHEQREALAVLRHRGRPGLAREALHELAVPSPLLADGAFQGDRLRRHLGGEAAVELVRRRAEHAGERFREAAWLARRQSAPDVDEARVSRALAMRQPLEKRRAHEVAHLPAPELADGVERLVRGQPPLERPLPEKRRPPHAVGTPASREPPLDVGRVSLADPGRDASWNRTEPKGEEAEQRTLERVSGGTREVREVRVLVDRQHLGPLAVRADRPRGRGGRGEQEHERRVDEREREPVRHVERIVHDHGHALIRRPSHQRADGVAHRLDAARHVQRPRLALGRVVDVEVLGRHRSPGELGTAHVLRAKGDVREQRRRQREKERTHA